MKLNSKCGYSFSELDDKKHFSERQTLLFNALPIACGSSVFVFPSFM